MASPTHFILPVLLLAALLLGSRAVPPTCERIECPSYDVVDQGNGFEIRLYNSTQWMSTSSIDDISFVNATRTGFLRCVPRALSSRGLRVAVAVFKRWAFDFFVFFYENKNKNIYYYILINYYY